MGIEVNVDEKGRLHLPKEVREDLGISHEGKVILVKEFAGYKIIPKRRYKNPTEELKKLAIKGSGHPNPKKEAREWMLSQLEKKLRK